MKPHHLLALFLAASPALADPPQAPVDEFDQGASLMEEGAKLLLRGLMKKAEPALNDMTAALDEARPQIMELLALIDNIANYHAPEILENGDILIRRKTPTELKLEGLDGPETDL